MQSPGWQPTMCDLMSDLVICLEKYGHTRHWMSWYQLSLNSINQTCRLLVGNTSKHLKLPCLDVTPEQWSLPHLKNPNIFTPESARDHTWHQMSLQIPGVIKCSTQTQHNLIPFSFSSYINLYIHKPLRKIKVTIRNHQADSWLYVWLAVWYDDLKV